MKNFSSVLAPMTEVLKCKRCQWKEKIQAALKTSKVNSLMHLSLPSQASPKSLNFSVTLQELA